MGRDKLSYSLIQKANSVCNPGPTLSALRVGDLVGVAQPGSPGPDPLEVAAGEGHVIQPRVRRIARPPGDRRALDEPPR